MNNPRNWIMAASAVLLLAAGLLLFAERTHEPDAGTGAVCTDQCGNGTCEEMVCMAVGCPCAETAGSCPQDCASTP